MRRALDAENFVFDNPKHHQRIIVVLEVDKPAGIITATERKPEQAGALHPFPFPIAMLDGGGQKDTMAT